MVRYPTCDFQQLDDESAIDHLRSIIDQRRPYSFIRLGDGEAVVLSLDDGSWLQDLAYLHGHWGPSRVTLGAVREVREGLVSALEGADLIGTRSDISGVVLPDDLFDQPSRTITEFVLGEFPLRKEEVGKLSEIGARRLALLHKVLSEADWRDDQLFCSAWLHWELLASGSLGEIVSGVDHVGLVTSRPEVQPLIENHFGVKTTLVTVPDKFVDSRESGAHVPDRFRTIRTELDFPDGTLVLVGAGIPGKVYCQWLKESGCIALDIGSVFDVWLGIPSRPMVLESRFKVRHGARVPAQLRLLDSQDHRYGRLVPRWKPERLAP